MPFPKVVRKDLLDGRSAPRVSASRARAKVREAGDVAREQVWGDYRWVVISDASEPDGLKGIDLGAGHSSSSESLCGRVLSALKSSALLNESVGAGYLERNLPPALKEDGAWPLLGLRQSFLDGSLTRLVDPDTVLRRRIVELVGKGDFGLASGRGANGRFERVWLAEPVAPEEVAFEADVYLLTKAAAAAGKAPVVPEPEERRPEPDEAGQTGRRPDAVTQPPTDDPRPPIPPAPAPAETTDKVLRVHGDIPAEVWNRLGTRLLPKLRGGGGRDLKIGVSFELTTSGSDADTVLADLRQILDDVTLGDRVRIDVD